MFQQVKVELCSICHEYIVSSKFDEHFNKTHKKCFSNNEELVNMSSAAQTNTDTSNDHIQKDNEKRIKNWTKSETLCLIEAYENNVIFESNTTKNRLGWIQISNDLKKKQIEYTSEQCQEKFKYLLSCYKKKLDNKHNTGSALYEFEFFNELNELFGKKPNIKPKYLASSSRIYTGPKENESTIDEEIKISAKRCHSPKLSSNLKKKLLMKLLYKRDMKKGWPCLLLHLKRTKHIWINC